MLKKIYLSPIYTKGTLFVTNILPTIEYDKQYQEILYAQDCQKVHWVFPDSVV